MVCTYVSFGVSCDNLDGIAIRYGMDVLGMKYRWRKKFPHLSWPALESTQPSMQWVPGLFQESKGGRDLALTTHFHLAPKLKKE